MRISIQFPRTILSKMDPDVVNVSALFFCLKKKSFLKLFVKALVKCGRDNL